MSIWHVLLYQPLLNLLVLFYKLLGQNLGVAIIAMTIFIRLLLLPLTLPSLKASKKIKELSPELEKLKKKHKDNKQALAQAQLKLYQKHGVNPAAGCMPQIIQIIILIALFQAFRQLLVSNGDVINKLNEVLYPPLQLIKEGKINSSFFYLDLTKPDLIVVPELTLFSFKINKLPGIFLISAAVVQFISSKLMMGTASAAQVKAKETKGKEDDMATAMQKQMLFLMPIMTLFIGISFPSGLVLYWLTFSAFLLVQQLIMKRKGS
jgi:YidC/Oxa1 family membrane protein insertase